MTHPTVFNRVLASGRTNEGGNLESTIALPELGEGSYRVTLVSSATNGARLKLTNHVRVDSVGKFASISAEDLQPLLN